MNGQQVSPLTDKMLHESSVADFGCKLWVADGPITLLCRHPFNHQSEEIPIGVSSPGFPTDRAILSIYRLLKKAPPPSNPGLHPLVYVTYPHRGSSRQFSIKEFSLLPSIPRGGMCLLRSRLNMGGEDPSDANLRL